jgi:hypothetical protein
LLKPEACAGPAAEQGLDGDRLELPGGGQQLSIEPTQLAERRAPSLAQAEFARPSPGRAPTVTFSFPCYISPE